MRYPKERKDETRRRIVDVAGPTLRAEGIDGAGVAAIMARAGLTHGGFYAHFPSKEALVAEACAAAVDAAGAYFRQVADAMPPALRAQAIADAYLTQRRRDEGSCALATLGSELGRQPAPVRDAFTRAFAASVEGLAPALPGADDEARTDAALTLLTSMIGAMTLARAVSDPVLADRILDAARRAVPRAAAAASEGGG